MAIVCFASQKGSPGVTTTALAVAAAASPGFGRRKLFVEADPSGGGVASTYGLSWKPGISTFAASAAEDRLAGVQSFWRHSQALPGGLRAIVAPDSPGVALAALTWGQADMEAQLTSANDTDLFVDLGRLGVDSSKSLLLGHAGVVAVLCRPELDDLQCAAERMQHLAVSAHRLRWLLVGARSAEVRRVEADYGFPVAGVVADDAAGASLLLSSSQSKQLARSKLARSAQRLASDLLGLARGTTTSVSAVSKSDTRRTDTWP